MSEGHHHGPWAASLPSPVSLLVGSSYVPDSQLYDINDGFRRLYVGPTVMLAITRFTVGQEREEKPPTTF